MIHVKELNIEYDKCLIENGDIIIPDGALVAISGESGVGKTSILYRLGLISISEDYTYMLDGEKVDLSNKKIVASIQQNEIGFLFQDGTMIDSLTVEENIILSAQTAGIVIQKDEIEELLENVKLPKEKMNVYPLKLSGGERQRASLAMVLAKKTKYIIADEPTASLDKENAKIIVNLLTSLKDKGYSVIISTHSKDIVDAADIVYVIQDKKIVSQNCLGEYNRDYISTEKRIYKLNKKNTWWYATHSRKKGKILNWILIILCAMGISGFAITNNVMSYLMNIQDDLLNRVSDREIYAVNLSTSSTDNSVMDSDGNLVINEEQIEQVSKMNGVDKIYEMMEWKSFNLNNPEITIANSINVINDVEEKSVSYSLDYSDLDYYICLPYFKEQNYEKQLVTQYSEIQSDGAYISYDLAEELGVVDYTGENLTLKFNIGIPVYKLVNVNEQIGEEDDLDLVKFESIEVKINGILDANVTNSYTIDGNSVIYLPYDYMKEVMKNCRWSGEITDFGGVQVIPWAPSAIVVYAASYKNVNVLQSKINCITPNIVSRYSYQDTVAIEQIVKGLKDIINFVVLIVLGIIFALMCAIYISTTVGRKREYAIMKANGFTAKEMGEITVIESFLQAVKIIILSLSISFVITTLLCKLLLNNFSMVDIKTIMYVVLLSFLFIMVPSLLSTIYINKLKVEKIIRN